MMSLTDPVKHTLGTAQRSLEMYVRREQYAGFDPYDGLTSSLLERLPFSNSRLLRLGFQQIIRRVPLNLRPLIGIQKGHNPVTYGLCLQAYLDALSFQGDRREDIEGQIAFCMAELERLRSPGFSQYCWGYDFPWEGKYVSLGAFAPTVVATGIVANALCSFHRISGEISAAEMCISAADFVRTCLQRTGDGSSFCFSYSPFDRQQVLNATLFGSRLLAQAFQITKSREYLSDAAKSVNFVLRHQRPDGSWPYAVGDRRQWTDSFHSAYVLECLHDYVLLSGDGQADDAIRKGEGFYLDSFFRGNIPKYYDNRTYPVDTTAAAQAILLLVRLGRIDRAVGIAVWTVERLQQRDGSFAYRDYRAFVSRISFMRWSNAWMLAALSRLNAALAAGRPTPAGADS